MLAAVKYLPAGAARRSLAEAGSRWWARTGPRSSQPKRRRVPGAFTWDFIGQLQSRKVKQILPYVRYIHSVASDSALEQLRRHGGAGHPVPGRGQRGRRGGQERGRPRRSSATSSSAARPPWWA